MEGGTKKRCGEQRHAVVDMRLRQICASQAPEVMSNQAGKGRLVTKQIRDVRDFEVEKNALSRKQSCFLFFAACDSRRSPLFTPFSSDTDLTAHVR